MKNASFAKRRRTSVARCMTPLTIAPPIVPSARSRVVTIGNATTLTATKIVDDTLTTIMTTTVAALCAERRSDPVTNYAWIAKRIATTTISLLTKSRCRLAEQKAAVALCACCTASRTAWRSTRGQSVRRTRPTKRSQQKGSRRNTPTTLIVRRATDPAMTTTTRMGQVRARIRAVARS